MTIRSTYFIGFLTIAILLLISIYLQFFDGFTPCPLCSLQRISFGLLGICFLVGILVHRKHWGRFLINTLCIFMSLIGIFLAGRQVWLQHFPTPGTTECGVSLQYLVKILPVNEVIQKVFAGSAECSQRGWEFLSLNMAEWSLLWFVIFLLFAIYLCMKSYQKL